MSSKPLKTEHECCIIISPRILDRHFLVLLIRLPQQHRLTVTDLTLSPFADVPSRLPQQHQLTVTDLTPSPSPDVPSRLSQQRRGGQPEQCRAGRPRRRRHFAGGHRLPGQGACRVSDVSQNSSSHFGRKVLTFDVFYILYWLVADDSSDCVKWL